MLGVIKINVNENEALSDCDAATSIADALQSCPELDAFEWNRAWFHVGLSHSTVGAGCIH